MSGEHDPSQPASQQPDDDARHVTRLLEFVFFLTVAAIGSAALFVLVGRSAWVLMLLGGVAGVFAWGSRGSGAAGDGQGADGEERR